MPPRLSSPRLSSPRLSSRPLRTPRAALAGALALACFAPAPVVAQAPDMEQAQRLFSEARAAQEQGRTEEACSKYRRSLELAEVANTLFNVARCDEAGGRLATALGRWRRGIALLRDGDERLPVAVERVAALARRAPHLTLTLSREAPPGARVLADGVEVPPSSLGAPLPFDPGAHALVVEAPGRRSQRLDVRLIEGESQQLTLSAGPAEAAPALTAPRPTSTAAPPPPPSGDGRRTLGLVIGGVGVAGLAAAGITGGLLLARDARIDEQCPDKRCTPEGRAEIDGAGSLLVVNAIAWGVGVAGVTAGAVLILTAPGEPAPQAAVGAAPIPGGGLVSMTGRF
jgi:hypothetical protein